MRGAQLTNQNLTRDIVHQRSNHSSDLIGVQLLEESICIARGPGICAGSLSPTRC